MIQEDSPAAKKLTQSKISSYFQGSRGIPKPEKIIKKRKMSRGSSRKSRAMSMESDNNSRTSSNVSTYSFPSTTPKRKLLVQIFSEDEDSDCENDKVTSNSIKKHAREESLVKTPSKKSFTMISLNKSNTPINSPQKPIWEPQATSTSSDSSSNGSGNLLDGHSSAPRESVSSSTPQAITSDPCCSKTLPPDCYKPCASTQNNNNFEKKSSSGNIRILSDLVIHSPEKRTTVTSPQKTMRPLVEKLNIENLDLPKRSSAVTSPQKAVKPEDGKLNFTYLDVMSVFFTNVLTNNCFKCLLSNKTIEMLKRFFEIERVYQYLCMKLFMWKPIWYNIFKYAEQIGLHNMNDTEIAAMYNCLKENKFVETDYSGEDLFTLLNLLHLKDLREINRSFKFLNSGTTRDSIINRLLNNCRTQLTLTYAKSTEQVLRERVQEKLGMCCRLSKELRVAFYNIYLLNTFTNPNIMKPQDYFKDMNIVFPAYKVEKYYIFYTEEEFLKYASATELRQALDDAIDKKNVPHIIDICKLSYDMLGQLDKDERNSSDSSRPLHLDRFTPQAQYISILTNALKHITTSAFSDVKVWLEYLISQEYCKHKRGAWYCQLSLIYTTYLKDYKAAAQLVISALEKEKDNLTDVQLHELAHRGKILDKKSYNLPTLFHDQIAAAGPPSCERDWPQIVVESKTVRSNEPGRKRKYKKEEANGDVSYLTVEQTALEHYLTSGFSEGKHCEGSLIRASFCLLFFDIIYENYVKATFVSEMQSVPLDMYTKYFYSNREKSIKIRINDIRENWLEDEMKRFLIDKWTKHSHESLLCSLESIVDSPELLFRLILCIGRTVIAKIFERLAQNYKAYQSGFPDLIVWNFGEKRAKFVEVKGENDTLSIKQKLWLNYLMDSGASVEVCHVHSRGSKKKSK